MTAFSEKQTAALQRPLESVLDATTGEEIEATVFQVLEDMRRIYEAVRTLHPRACKFDLSLVWVPEVVDNRAAPGG